jgi:hypothetical protein
MKKFIPILAAFIIASCLALGAQSLKDNPSYQKSLELKAMAVQAYDDGDYDAAADYAAQAKEYASLSDQYVEKMLAKYKADNAIAQAKVKMEWADGIDAMTLYPEQYGAASDEYSSSLTAYDAEDYPESADRAQATVAAVGEIAVADADAAIAQAKEKIDWADSIDAKSLYPDQYAEASDALSGALGAYDSENYPESAAWARSAVKAVDAIEVADADAAIAQAKDKIAWADGIDAKERYADQYAEATDALSGALADYDEGAYIGAAAKARSASQAVDAIAKADADTAIAQAKTALGAAEAIDGPANYPDEYAQGKAALTDAEAAYDSEDYLSAAQRARDCVAALAGVRPKEVVAVEVPKVEVVTWPAVYVVRLIPARRDCLWRIAEYPFIYNNPLKWPVIYEANKKTFRDPSNPNLIFPGQKLKIPSIKGEAREGAWDPQTEYQAFPKK